MSIEILGKYPSQEFLDDVYKLYCSTGCWELYFYIEPFYVEYMNCRDIIDAYHKDRPDVNLEGLISGYSDDIAPEKLNEFTVVKIEFSIGSYTLIQSREKQIIAFDFIRWLGEKFHVPIQVTDECLVSSPFLIYISRHNVFLDLYHLATKDLKGV